MAVSLAGRGGQENGAAFQGARRRENGPEHEQIRDAERAGHGHLRLRSPRPKDRHGREGSHQKVSVVDVQFMIEEGHVI